MLTTPDKICILSPGRCGSQYLLSLLGIHFCNRPWDLEHTHNLEYALELERQDFEVITVRRYDMFEWTLSRAVSDYILNGKMDGEEQFHNQNVDFSFELTPEQYITRRDAIQKEYQSYNEEWRVFFYEDIVKNPIGVVNNILGCANPPLTKTKLNYRKEDIVKNYAQLKQIEESANFNQYRNV